MNIFIAEIRNNLAHLTSDESWHCARVLRKKAGDNVQLIDGLGNFYFGKLLIVSDKDCVCEITAARQSQSKRNYFLHLAIAPTKQIDRVEWMIEKAVEIGVDEISFITCTNSERTVIKAERIRKIVESAVKQSLQAFIPRVNDLVSYSVMLKNNQCNQKFIAHCFESPKMELRNVGFNNASTLVLIGPEGDFTQQEVVEAVACGYKTLSLGAHRLRTETAGLYICQAASILC